MTPQPRTARRTYRGLTPEQRDAERRGRLVDAALRLYAEQRTAEVPVALVCSMARVSTRQFYEVFGDQSELFVAVYEHSAAVALRHVEEAINGADASFEAQLRALLERLFGAREDEELGRALAVLFVLGATSHTLMQRRAAAIANAVEVLAVRLAPTGAGPPPLPRMAVFVAALVELLELSWRGHAVAPADQMIEEVLRVFAPALDSP